jgi:uncharacterized membrane protein YkvA (DUF1232 family)
LAFDKWKQRVGELKVQTYSLVLAYRDPRTPWYAKAWAGLVVAYALSPIDLIPDFIPVLGILDDLLLVPLGIALALRMIPAEVMTEARQAASRAPGPGSPLDRLGMALVILVWLGALALAGLLIVSLVRGARR